MDIDLHISKVELRLNPVETISLPAYQGAAFRGGFGHAFRKAVCAVRKDACDDCLVRHSCAYSYVFETPPPPDTGRMRKYTRAPHPFVIEPPLDRQGTYEPGEPIEFSLILIGRKAREFLPYFIFAFETLGRMGIGKGKGRYILESVRSNGNVIYTQEERNLGAPGPCLSIPDEHRPTHRLGLKFITPTRIVYNERLIPEPDFHHIVRNLLRRLSSLSYFHCGKELDLNYTGLIERAEKIKTVKKDIKWMDIPRYSTRQKTYMKLGGFVGEVEFEGDLTEFMPYLRLGEVVHIGKATSFGLGKYVITPSLILPLR